MKGKAGKFVASIVELFTREVKAQGVNNIYTNDADNLYPQRVELVERNSVTAFAASNKLKSFIIGKGFRDESLNELVVNTAKKLTGYKFLALLAHSLKTHRGAFVHVNYDIEGKVNYLDVLPYKKCRIAKEDGFGYPGKIYYKDWSEAKTFTAGYGKDADRWFYPFNNDTKVIADQRAKDAKTEEVEALVRDYRGQVYFLSLDETEVYPYAWLHPAYNDADSEYRTALYRNSNLRTGFLGKTMIVAPGLDPETQNDLDDKVKEWLGAENSSPVFVMKSTEVVEDPSKVIGTVELKGSYDSKRFENDEKSIANNIRKAYLSIPQILIDPEDSFFGSSGEAFREAIEYYNKETLFIRENIAYMMDAIGFKEYENSNWTINELGDDVQSGNTTD